MSICIDSSVFISALGDKDIYSDISRKFFQKLENEEIIISALVVAEVINILRKQKTVNVEEVYNSLISFRLIDINQKLLKELLEVSTQSPSLKTSDLIVALTAKMEKAMLITWDKKLLSSASSICLVKTPNNY